MKRTVHKIVSLLLAAALCLGAAACGASTEGSSLQEISTFQDTSSAPEASTLQEASGEESTDETAATEVSSEAPAADSTAETAETPAPTTDAEPSAESAVTETAAETSESVEPSETTEESAAPSSAPPSGPTVAPGMALSDLLPGYYPLYSMPAEGGPDAVRELASYGAYVFLVIEPGGTGFIHLMGKEQELVWDAEAGTMTIGGDAAVFLLESDDLLTVFEDGQPAMIFSRSEEAAPARGEMRAKSLGLSREDEVVLRRVLLADTKDFTVTVTGITLPENVFDDYAVGLFLRNKTEDRELGFSAGNVVVNGVNLESFFHALLAPGETKETKLEISLSDIRRFGIGDPTQISVRLEVMPRGTAAPLFRSYLTLYPLGDGKAETFVREAADTDLEVFDDENLRLSFIGIRDESAAGFVLAEFWAENKTDGSILVSFDDCAVNGGEPDFGPSVVIAPGACGPMQLIVETETLAKAEGQITGLAFTLDVRNEELKKLAEGSVSFQP